LPKDGIPFQKGTIMKTIIAGSRDIKDYHYLVGCMYQVPWLSRISEVVSGGALGVDRLGERWAAENGKPVKVFPADWEKYGKNSGPIRNQEMAEYADALILLWWGDPRKSPGSFDMLRKAKAEGLIRRAFTYVKV
jgi:hypothetical protein